MMSNYLIKILLIIVLALAVGSITSCQLLPEPTPIPTTLPTPTVFSTPSPISTPIVLSEPEPLPLFLPEVRPFPSSIISQQEFHTTVIADNYITGGPPPPPVEITGYNSSVCFHFDVTPLVEAGDFLFWEEQVLPLTELNVDGEVLTTRAETNYLAVYEPGPDCRCFFDCEDYEYWHNWSSGDPIPSNLGCWFWHGFWACYPVELESGIHTASFMFNQSSGIVQEYHWEFGITD